MIWDIHKIHSWTNQTKEISLIIYQIWMDNFLRERE